jgi:hypothetical protein
VKPYAHLWLLGYQGYRYSCGYFQLFCFFISIIITSCGWQGTLYYLVTLDINVTVDYMVTRVITVTSVPMGTMVTFTRFEIHRTYTKNCVTVRIYLIQKTEYESKAFFNDVIWNAVSLTGFLLSIQTSKLVRTKQTFLVCTSLEIVGC